MKLKLEKQKVTTLTSEDMTRVQGGGEKWSDFRTGNCKYSSTHADTVCVYDPVTGLGQEYVIGCTAEAAASRD